MVSKRFLVCVLRCFKWRAIPAALIILLLSIILIPQALASDTGALNPSAAGSDGSGVDWSNPTNVYSSDNGYATVTAPRRNIISASALYATGFGFTIPDGATINGVKVEVERKYAGTGGAVYDNLITLWKDGSAYGSQSGTSWSTSEGYATFGGATSLWGTTLTPAIINDAGFGFGISAEVGAGALATCTAYIDHIRMTVYYTAPAGDSVAPNISLISPIMLPFRKPFENYLPLAYMIITMITVFLLV